MMARVLRVCGVVLLGLLTACGGSPAFSPVVACPGWEGWYTVSFSGVWSGEEQTDSLPALIILGTPPSHICLGTAGWYFDFALPSGGLGYSAVRRYCGVPPANFGATNGRFEGIDESNQYEGVWEFTKTDESITGHGVEVNVKTDSSLVTDIQVWGTKNRDCLAN